MEGQERSGFKDLHRFLGRIPLPFAKGDRAMLHSEALEGGFIPKMDEEEQKRFTQSELLLNLRPLPRECGPGSRAPEAVWSPRARAASRPE